MLATLITLSVASAVAASSQAADVPSPPMLTEIREGEAVRIKPDRAYLLFRVHRPKGVPAFEPVFMRKPTSPELEAYRAAKQQAFDAARPKLVEGREKALQRQAESTAQGRKTNAPVPPEPSLDNFPFFYRAHNLAAIRHNFVFGKGATDNLYLIEAIPGDYVLYGLSWGTGPQMLAVCWCLGTVGFAAKPGVISDLGTMYFDKAKFRSDIPELRDETGFGPSSDTPGFLLAGTVRPDRRDGVDLSGLRGNQAVPATFHAVGLFVDRNNAGVNRLGPVPGILEYKRGRPMDVASGQPARSGTSGR